MTDLLAGHTDTLAPGAVLLHGFVAGRVDALLTAVAAVAEAAPWRHVVARTGFAMSVAITNCGPLGWTSDRPGYRYVPDDPVSGRRWPPLPDVFRTLARDAAGAAGFAGFVPDVCLMNRYAPGARMGLHQDRDEPDMAQPIVSVSLGLPAVFLWGGAARADKVARHPLAHGDVVVFGGPARLFYHGIAPLKPGDHPATGAARINLTFRRATRD